MAEVARYLGISKATVSLAVNGKPGVNSQTRERIFRCIEEMSAVDYEILNRIQKPLVLYDYEMPNVAYNSVYVENGQSAWRLIN